MPDKTALTCTKCDGDLTGIMTGVKLLAETIPPSVRGNSLPFLVCPHCQEGWMVTAEFGIREPDAQETERLADFLEQARAEHKQQQQAAERRAQARLN